MYNSLYTRRMLTEAKNSTAEACLANMSTNHALVTADSYNCRCPERTVKSMLEVRAAAPGWCKGSKKWKQVA